MLSKLPDNTQKSLIFVHCIAAPNSLRIFLQLIANKFPKRVSADQKWSFYDEYSVSHKNLLKKLAERLLLFILLMFAAIIFQKILPPKDFH